MALQAAHWRSARRAARSWPRETCKGMKIALTELAEVGKPGVILSIQNVAMRCRTHNLYEAELYYGLRGIPLRWNSVVKDEGAVYGTRERGLERFGP